MVARAPGVLMLAPETLASKVVALGELLGSSTQEAALVVGVAPAGLHAALQKPAPRIMDRGWVSQTCMARSTRMRTCSC